ncbi:MAG: hypothetical protein JNL01_02500 [Bdellovibrionales bacterium]|nr:hypothetical protein [Bdellovibrionales bacterium]
MPDREIQYQTIFRSLSKKLRTPKQVQAWLRAMPYNREKGGETLRSALSAYHAGTAHCLEACFLAAAVLESQGYPAQVMSMESQDDLDHVIFVFKARTGWGSVARSRDEGLHGREPRFRSLRDLAYSYFDPYVDHSGKVTAYGAANLDDLGADWRKSPTNVWKIEKELIDLKHQPLKSSKARYQKLLANYHAKGPLTSGPGWW